MNEPMANVYCSRCGKRWVMHEPVRPREPLCECGKKTR